MNFIAYHDRTSGDHQSQFDKLYNNGYRMISLSVYGDRSNPLYAAVWAQRSGLPWAAIHNASSKEYQDFCDHWSQQGFRPVLLTVSGPVENPVFAGTVEKNPAGTFQIKYGLYSKPVNGDPTDKGSIEYWNFLAKQNGLILACASIYGGGQPGLKYAGVWETNSGKVVWNADGVNESAMEYQNRCNAQVSGWARPAFVTSCGPSYLSVFRDDQIGPWVARHDLTGQQYQDEFNNWTKQGFYPLSVQGSRVGQDTRFSVLFVKQEQPVARSWTVTGSPNVIGIDDEIKKFMQAHNVRGASLAVIKDKRLVLARGYSWAEPGYTPVQPTTLFRQASCSKLLTGIAIYQLLSEGKKVLDFSDTVHSILQLKTPTGKPPTDPGFEKVTIKQLLEHKAAVPDQYEDHETEIAAAFNVKIPVNAKQIASFMMTKGLLETTGYSNYGYFLLGLVATFKRNHPYDFMKVISERIMSPLQVTRMRLARSLVNMQDKEEARYHSPNLALRKSVMTPDQPWVPLEYGDEQLEVLGPSGGISASAIDMVRVVAALNVEKNNPILSHDWILSMLNNVGMSGGHGWDAMGTNVDGTKYYQKGGWLQTSQNGLYYEQGGIGYSLNWNTESLPSEPWYPCFEAIVHIARTYNWPAGDLFPSYKMDSFK